MEITHAPWSSVPVKRKQVRRLGGFGAFGRTARTQAKVRGAEADADLSKISSADTIYVVAYRLA